MLSAHAYPPTAPHPAFQAAPAIALFPAGAASTTGRNSAQAQPAAKWRVMQRRSPHGLRRCVGRPPSDVLAHATSMHGCRQCRSATARNGRLRTRRPYRSRRAVREPIRPWHRPAEGLVPRSTHLSPTCCGHGRDGNASPSGGSPTRTSRFAPNADVQGDRHPYPKLPSLSSLSAWRPSGEGDAAITRRKQAPAPQWT